MNALPVLTADVLQTAVGDLPSSGTLVLPGGASAAVADLSAAALAMAAADDPNATLVFRNPIAALSLALAAADWSGQSGAIDLSALLPKLPLTPARIVLPQLPGAATTDALDSAVPLGLTLRPGTALLLAGTLPDGRIALAIADPARQVAGHPRLELAILSSETLTPLLDLAGAALDPSGAAVTVSGARVLLAPVDPTLATRLVSRAGVLFVDQLPLQPTGATTPVLTLDPIVPVPDASLVPAWASVAPSGGASVQHSSDGRIPPSVRFRRMKPEASADELAREDERDIRVGRRGVTPLAPTTGSVQPRSRAPDVRWPGTGSSTLCRSSDDLANVLESLMAGLNHVFGRRLRLLLVRLGARSLGGRRVPDAAFP